MFLFILVFSDCVTTRNQSDYRSLPLREIDVADQRATSCLTLRVENSQCLTESCALIVRAKPDFDLRIIARELHAHVAQVHQVCFAHALRNSLCTPVALQFEKLRDTSAILCLCPG